jgi:hypothetical protein
VVFQGVPQIPDTGCQGFERKIEIMIESIQGNPRRTAPEKLKTIIRYPLYDVRNPAGSWKSFGYDTMGSPPKRAVLLVRAGVLLMRRAHPCVESFILRHFQ